MVMFVGFTSRHVKEQNKEAYICNDDFDSSGEMLSENVILRSVLIDLSIIPSHLAFKMCSNYSSIKMLQ